MRGDRGLERRTVARQRDAAPVAVEETGRELLFQLPQIPAEGGLRHAQMQGGLHQAAGLGDHQEILELPQLHSGYAFRI